MLDALPRSAQPAARKALAEIRDAEDREHAEPRVKAYAEMVAAKHLKAVAKVVENHGSCSAARPPAGSQAA